MNKIINTYNSVPVFRYTLMPFVVFLSLMLWFFGLHKLDKVNKFTSNDIDFYQKICDAE